jgi:hypothetical protein
MNIGSVGKPSFHSKSIVPGKRKKKKELNSMELVTGLEDETEIVVSPRHLSSGCAKGKKRQTHTGTGDVRAYIIISCIFFSLWAW